MEPRKKSVSQLREAITTSATKPGTVVVQVSPKSPGPTLKRADTLLEKAKR